MPKCPKCGSKNIGRHIYGLLLFSDELLKEVDRGKIILGGCIILEGVPKYHCNDCDEDFGGVTSKNRY